MATLLELQNRARKLTPKKVKTDLFDFIRTIEKELAAYNKATLFQDSENVKGKPIGFYSYATELITNGEKAKGQPFNLKDTGEFLEEIFAKVQKDSIFFDTKDPKKKKVLSNLLTDDIFGLQDEDLNKFLKERVTPFLQNYYRKNLLE